MMIWAHDNWDFSSVSVYFKPPCQRLGKSCESWVGGLHQWMQGLVCSYKSTAEGQTRCNGIHESNKFFLPNALKFRDSHKRGGAGISLLERVQGNKSFPAFCTVTHSSFLALLQMATLSSGQAPSCLIWPLDLFIISIMDTPLDICHFSNSSAEKTIIKNSERR